MADITVIESSGQISIKSGSFDQLYPTGGSLSAAAGSTADGVTVTYGSQILMREAHYARFVDGSGTDLSGTRAGTVTALNALFDKKVLEDFIVKDETSGLTGTTKIRHKEGSGGADRDAGGTLELDLHSASIGLYGSYLKITEEDLNNTSGKNSAYGRLQVFLENAGTPVEVLDMEMSSLVQAPAVDLNTSSLDVSGDVTFSSASGTVTFSGDTSGIAYGDISGTPTIPTNVSDLTNDSGFITGANELDGQIIEVITRSTAYGNGSYEGVVVKYDSDTLVNNKTYVYTSTGWVATNANTESKTYGLFGLALGTSSSTNGLLVRGIRGSTAFSGFTAGQLLYIDTNDGAITATAPTATGDFVRVIGYALGSNYIYIDPSPDYIELS